MALALLVGCQNGTKEETQEPEPVVDTRQFLLDICIDSLDVEEQVIKQGESLSTILTGVGVSPVRIDTIANCDKEVFNIAHLRAGAHYTLLTNPVDSVLHYFVYHKSLKDFVVFDLRSTMRIYNYAKPLDVQPRTTAGVITSSLWNAIVDSHTNPELANKLSDLYAWQIDFFGIDRGDSFKVLYDYHCVDDSIEVSIGDINGAQFTHRGRTFYAIPFVQDSVRGFFDEEGQSLRKAFLKAPLHYSRISSRFSNGRYHPVLKIVRPHHGIDYAAPAGTPVVSIGDGVVVQKGYQARGGGNYLKIKHNALYTTSYMHLSRFAKDIQLGSVVTQGQLIAYVGSTGLSTGPHLDFRVYRGGQAIDPLTMESPSVEPVAEELRDSFDVVKNGIIAALDSIHIANN